MAYAARRIRFFWGSLKISGNEPSDLKTGNDNFSVDLAFFANSQVSPTEFAKKTGSTEKLSFAMFGSLGSLPEILREPQKPIAPLIKATGQTKTYIKRPRKI